jgi:hypothetical protein
MTLRRRCDERNKPDKCESAKESEEGEKVIRLGLEIANVAVASSASWVPAIPRRASLAA